MLQYMYVLSIPGQRSKSRTITVPENLKNFVSMKIIFDRGISSTATNFKKTTTIHFLGITIGIEHDLG